MLSEKLLEIFCSVDDFCQQFEPKFNQLQLSAPGKRNRKRSLCLSEIMTILIGFHTSGFRTFKHYYHYLLQEQRSAFPGLVSYSRFVYWIPSAIIPLCSYLNTRKGQQTGLNFIDSTALKVCHNKRIQRNRVFKGIAARGKSTMGYFYGFKLHLVINELGELLAFCLTPGNIDDRKPVKKLARELWGKLFGDKGYISQRLTQELLDKGVHLITQIRDNMKNKLMSYWDRILLRKRSLIETVNDQLKNICQVEHSRHRSPQNFMVHLVAGLAAYTHQSKKPQMNWHLQNAFAIAQA